MSTITVPIEVPTAYIEVLERGGIKPEDFAHYFESGILTHIEQVLVDRIHRLGGQICEAVDERGMDTVESSADEIKRSLAAVSESYEVRNSRLPSEQDDGPAPENPVLEL